MHRANRFRARRGAATRADFPGIHGKIYRALVIGTGGHGARGGVVTYAVRPEGRLPTSRARAVRWSAIDRAVLTLGDLVMMRKQLLTLKSLSERDAAAA